MVRPRLLSCVFAAANLVALLGSAGAAPATPDVGAPAASPSHQTEFVALQLRGPKPWQRLDVLDLDVLTRDDGGRLLPLRRLLKTLRRRVDEQNGRLAFRFDGGPAVTLDPDTGKVELDGQADQVTVIRARSEITGEAELYVPAEHARRWLALPLEWDDMEYAFKATTERQLSIWDAPERPSLMSIDAQLLPADLPELFPAARPRAFSLDFLEVQMRLGGDLVTRDDQPRQLALSSLEQTFWGRAFGGGYKLRLTQPALRWDRGRGLDTTPDDVDLFQVRSFDWVKRHGRGHVLVGDASTGLNDLVFPFMSFTGVQFSGVAGEGWDKAQVTPAGWAGGAGVVTPRAFTGIAEVGSTVELIIDDRVVDTDEVIAIDPDAPPGFGTWQFEDIRLPPGVLNEVRIRVTDPRGEVTQIQRSVLGASNLLPRGGVAYLAGAGAKRQVTQLDLGGLVVGGRVMWGLADRLTLGMVIARQDRFHHAFSPDSALPIQSNHLGFEVYWQPLDRLFLVADAALSVGAFDDGGSYADAAAFLRAEYHTPLDVVLSGSVFHYGPDYFNGQSNLPRNRRGFWLAGRWQGHERLALDVAGGWVTGVESSPDAPVDTAHFQHLDLFAQPIGRMSVGYSFDRIAARGADQPSVLHTLEVDTAPLANLKLSALHSRGDDLELDAGEGFFSGLNLPGINLGQTARTNATARLVLGGGHSVAVHYDRTENAERLTFLHDLRMSQPWRMIMHSEVGRQLRDDELFFDHRSDLLLDRHGDWRVGLRVHGDDQWVTVGLFLTVTDQYIVHDGGMSPTRAFAPTPETYLGSVSPDTGGGVRGRVFVDVDADGLRDPDEPGLEGVTVHAGPYDRVTTNERGGFVVPSIRPARSVRVWLDIETLPAIYSPTHGVQTAVLEPRTLTVVNLGVAPSHSISGRFALTTDGRRSASLGGIRVRVVNEGGDKPVAESITASNGSYYLGDLRPGRYRVVVDRASLPPGVLVDMPETVITIDPAAEPIDRQLPPIPARFEAAPEQSGKDDGASAPTAPRPPTEMVLPH